MLTAPIRREELLFAKALAVLLSAAVAYAVYTLFRACVERFALRTMTSALVHPAELLASLAGFSRSPHPNTTV